MDQIYITNIYLLRFLTDGLILDCLLNLVILSLFDVLDDKDAVEVFFLENLCHIPFLLNQLNLPILL